MLCPFQRWLTVFHRKTGVTLRDTGARDEHGMQPLEDIFSSPEKTARITTHDATDDYSDDSSGQEMDIENSMGPCIAIALSLSVRVIQLTSSLPSSHCPRSRCAHAEPWQYNEDAPPHQSLAHENLSPVAGAPEPPS